MTARFAAWECIGCGRIEGAQPCIGVCQDRRTEFVRASDHEAALAQLERAGQRLEALARIVRQVAFTYPRNGQCERTWRALQARAREALEVSSGDGGGQAP